MNRPFIFICHRITPVSKEKNHALEYLDNIRKGFQAGERLIREGFSVYCPATDLHFWLSGNSNLTIEEIYGQDLAIIKKCDALFVLPGWEGSENCCREVEQALEFNKPVFTDIETMKIWRDQNEAL